MVIRWVGLLLLAASTLPAYGQPAALAVIVAQVTARPLADRVEALGTARANESVDITSPVSDLVRQIHFDDGDIVSAGQVLVELDYTAEQAELRAAQAQLKEKRSVLARARELKSKSLVSQAELDLAQAEVDSLVARGAALEAAIADRVIRAPFAGVLGLRQISPGAFVTPGQLISTLYDLSVLKIDFTVPETRALRLAPQARIIARSQYLPGEQFPARVEAISPGVDVATRSVGVRGLMPSPDSRLKPGMLLELEVLTGEREALMVPESALISRGSEQFVYTVRDDRAAQQLVVAGTRRDGQIEIVDGLAAGDVVIVHGGNKARPGQPVRSIGVFDGKVPLAELIRQTAGAS